MALDKYSRLKIASNILDEPISQMAESWGVTFQSVKDVCNGKMTSKRLSKNINKKIRLAEKKFDQHRERKLNANQQ